MSGNAEAVKSGKDLEQAVVEVGLALGLNVERQVKVGKRIWGADRYIDVIFTQPETRLRLGIECKYQSSTGSAEEKVPTTIADIKVWPIRGLVVFAGEGFSPHMRSYLFSTGMAVELEDLRAWLQLFFGLPLSEYEQPRLL